MENVVHFRRELVRTPLTTRITNWVGRLGTERAMKREINEAEANTFGRRRIAAGALIGTVAGAIVLMGGLLIASHEAQDNQVDDIERCVRAATGRDIDLKIDPASSQMIVPAELESEIADCREQVLSPEE